MVPAAVIIAFLLLGVEEIGVQIEEPFGILPLGLLSSSSAAAHALEMFMHVSMHCMLCVPDLEHFQNGAFHQMAPRSCFRVSSVRTSVLQCLLIPRGVTCRFIRVPSCVRHCTSGLLFCPDSLCDVMQKTW